ncbi:hypothetical protein AV530_010934 [Patagioenas fasciata monilis]|uniref:Uncharacterized protein n=1 Tax=Patagioenas fasciata monilis TaxID=372326 RepID=A0A1V4K886_PATFA|nr:hypothetical protein AV530_010934 [Patagioenas fasciata monilis]
MDSPFDERTQEACVGEEEGAHELSIAFTIKSTGCGQKWTRHMASSPLAPYPDESQPFRLQLQHMPCGQAGHLGPRVDATVAKRPNAIPSSTIYWPVDPANAVVGGTAL